MGSPLLDSEGHCSDERAHPVSIRTFGAGSSENQRLPREPVQLKKMAVCNDADPFSGKDPVIEVHNVFKQGENAWR